MGLFQTASLNSHAAVDLSNMSSMQMYHDNEDKLLMQYLHIYIYVEVN